MKTLIAALGLLAVGASAASAQFAPHNPGLHPYAPRYHGVCQEKAMRLHNYELRSARDGRIDRHERDVIRALERDLDRTCGRYRFHR